jgi:hypothetical protein
MFFVLFSGGSDTLPRPAMHTEPKPIVEATEAPLTPTTVWRPAANGVRRTTILVFRIRTKKANRPGALNLSTNNRPPAGSLTRRDNPRRHPKTGVISIAMPKKPVSPTTYYTNFSFFTMHSGRCWITSAKSRNFFRFIFNFLKKKYVFWIFKKIYGKNWDL